MGISIKYVILGMLVEREGYGYDLRCRIERRLPFLSYTAGAVYPALDSLERAGLIVATGTKAHGRVPRGSPRVMYESTDQGRATFARWMHTFSPPAPSRDELSAKLELARPSDMLRLIEMTRKREADLRSHWHELTSSPAEEWTEPGRVPWRLVVERLNRSREARRIAAEIESFEEIREALRFEINPPPARSELPPR